MEIYGLFYSNVRFFVTVTLRMERTSSEETIESTIYLNSGSRDLYPATDISDRLDEVFANLNDRLDTWESKGSGWRLLEVSQITISHCGFDPLRAGTYFPSPKRISQIGGCINIKNNDKLCFIYSMLTGLHPVQMHPERVSHYTQYLHELNYKGLEFPFNPRHTPQI